MKLLVQTQLACHWTLSKSTRVDILQQELVLITSFRYLRRPLRLAALTHKQHKRDSSSSRARQNVQRVTFRRCSPSLAGIYTAEKKLASTTFKLIAAQANINTAPLH